jgi:two-component system chemotaxis response regulator CheB
MVRNDEGFAGTLKHIQLNDLIQMCCLSAASLTIRVKQGQRSGTIHIREGEIVHAVVDDICGEQAFYQVLGWESGVFETIDATRITEKTIAKNYQFLLMEAAHQADERGGRSGKSANLSASAKQMDAGGRIRVLIVEDSAMMRKILTSMLNADSRICVVDTAKNGEEALNMIDAQKPDLILLDVNMPVMDGSTALKHIMIKKPCPVVIMSNMGGGSHKNIIEFLNLGAVDFMSKPVKNKDIVLQQQKIVERIHAAAGARLNAFRRVKTVQSRSHESAAQLSAADRLVVIRVGAGGHADLVNLLAALPADLAACVLALKAVPPALVPDLADYYHHHSSLPVFGLTDSSIELKNNCCYFGTSGRYMRVAMQDRQPVISMQKEMPKGAERMHYLDFLLNSLFDIFASRLMLVLLSGADFGSLDDLSKIKTQKGQLIVQEPASCMVVGSLEEIIGKGLADGLADVSQIAKAIAKFASHQPAV